MDKVNVDMRAMIWQYRRLVPNGLFPMSRQYILSSYLYDLNKKGNYDGCYLSTTSHWLLDPLAMTLPSGNNDNWLAMCGYVKCFYVTAWL